MSERDSAYRDNRETALARVQTLELELARRRFLIASLVQILRKLLDGVPEARPSFWRASVLGLPFAIGFGYLFYFGTGGLFPSLVGALIVAWTILGVTGHFVGRFLAAARSSEKILQIAREVHERKRVVEIDKVLAAIDEHESECAKLDRDIAATKTLTEGRL